MLKITLDHTSKTVDDKHPVIHELHRMEKEGKIKLDHHISRESELGNLQENDKSTYNFLMGIIYPKHAYEGITHAEHVNLMLLLDHMKSGGDFFVTLDRENFLRQETRNRLESEFGLKIAYPDEKFLKKVKGEKSFLSRIFRR